MKPVIYDDELRAKLGDLKEHVQLRSVEGEPVARVIPEADYRAFIYRLATSGHDSRPMPTREEILADIRAGRYFTTEQVLEHLHSLDGDPS